eukprot:9739525-Ditylum_brightwellii.AAC.2
MAWLQIQAKSECLTGLSDDSTLAEEGDNNEDKKEDSQDFLLPNMVQIRGMLSAAKKTATARKKSVIEFANKDSDSESYSSDSAFKKRPFKKAKKVKTDRKAEKSVKKPVIEKIEHISVASSVSTHKKKKLM